MLNRASPYVVMIDPEAIEPGLLRALVAVAETGSFTRAAERLRLTQPAVSTQVRRLEERLGRGLIQRGGGSAPAPHLTGDGEAMLGYARDILEVVNRVRRHFSQPSLEGSVRFGSVEDFGATVLPDLLGRLRREHAHFELTAETRSSEHLLHRLHAGSLDLVLAKRVAGQPHGERLGRQRLVWVGLPETLSPRASDPVPLVLYPAPSVTRDLLLDALRRAGRTWSVRFESASLVNLRAAVLAGLGVSAFGVGMTPAGLTALPASVGLPSLAHAEFILAQRPDVQDSVVASFGNILRTVAPLIIQRLEEETEIHQ